MRLQLKSLMWLVTPSLFLGVSLTAYAKDIRLECEVKSRVEIPHLNWVYAKENLMVISFDSVNGFVDYPRELYPTTLNKCGRKNLREDVRSDCSCRVDDEKIYCEFDEALEPVSWKAWFSINRYSGRINGKLSITNSKELKENSMTTHTGICFAQAKRKF